jgi:hypothetical protein
MFRKTRKKNTHTHTVSILCCFVVLVNREYEVSCQPLEFYVDSKIHIEVKQARGEKEREERGLN